MRHELQNVFPCHLIGEGFPIRLSEQFVKGVAVGEMSPFLAMSLDEIQIVVDGLRHRYVLGLDLLAALDDSDSLCTDFDGFAPGGLDDLGKTGTAWRRRLPASYHSR